MAKRLDSELVERIKTLLRDGMPCKGVASELNCKLSTVWHIRASHPGLGASLAANRPRSGWHDQPRSVSDVMDREASRCPSCGHLVYMPCVLCSSFRYVPCTPPGMYGSNANGGNEQRRDDPSPEEIEAACERFRQQRLEELRASDPREGGLGTPRTSTAVFRRVSGVPVSS